MSMTLDQLIASIENLPQAEAEYAAWLAEWRPKHLALKGELDALAAEGKEIVAKKQQGRVNSWVRRFEARKKAFLELEELKDEEEARILLKYMPGAFND